MSHSDSLLKWLMAIAICTLSSKVSPGQEPVSSSAIIKTSQPLPNSLPNDGSGGVKLPEEIKDVRVQAIQQRIDIIKDIMARKQAAAEAAAAASEGRRIQPENNTAPADNERSSVPTSKGLVENTSESSEPNPETIRNPKLTSTDIPSSALSLNSGNSAAHGKPSVNPLDEFQISLSPLNSLELSNSLFQTGHYAQSLKGYEALLTKEPAPQDQDWLRLLAANCHRILGQLSPAERYYREVVSSNQRTYPSDHAKWYLDHLTRRKQLKDQIQLIDVELQSLSRNPQKN